MQSKTIIVIDLDLENEMPHKSSVCVFRERQYVGHKLKEEWRGVEMVSKV